MRRFLIILVLLLLLGVSYFANRLTAHLHYIVPVEAGKVAYLATFDDFKSDWAQAEGRLKTQILDTGVLRITVGDVDKLPFSQAKPYFSDFDIRAQMTAVDGPEGNGFGLIFRLQTKDNSSLSDDEFYLFEISSDGYYRVLRQLFDASKGESIQKNLSTWIPSPVINQHIGAANFLRVNAKGDHFQFYVNNHLMQLCIPDDPNAESTFPATGECVGGKMLDTLIDASIPNGQLGVVAQSLDEQGVVVDFDNVVVYGPS
ncbi:MAG: hypothetical protein GC179_04905 [Anaerolineaceae bacterium]|nr:hypothetical protein [Anaerolineaceae bacterium]